MEAHQDDEGVMAHIKKLNDRVSDLYRKEDLTDADIAEIHKVKSELDQYWDLLHQRQGLRDNGGNPDHAKIRSAETIKNYKN
ncbi:DUF2630 family protein [Mucilaginibacter gilvus]|uniref:DUF2630 family protein n=1 Tax=Mucilaginibacter gilvus TaxID=2305909 RepID=A0A3S3V7R7_9SPHI|nr:DUF2630 family protein [Mucilaginibacter gilvus]RWY47368.1 DUF2630 family protein [Mucilaginibacter gilvus]